MKPRNYLAGLVHLVVIINVNIFIVSCCCYYYYYYYYSSLDLHFARQIVSTSTQIVLVAGDVVPYLHRE